MSLNNSEQLALAINMLNGKRFNYEANKNYIMPADIFNAAQTPQEIGIIVGKFLNHHFLNEAPRITQLEKYYVGDNDIHYWINGKHAQGRADNRITSGFGSYISNIRTGYMLGNPIKFEYNGTDGDTVSNMVDSFNSKTDEPYHEKTMKTYLSVTGRAYELLVSNVAPKDANGNTLTAPTSVYAIDPATAFVVYDTSIEQHSLFGVRYYLVDYDGIQNYYVDVYTADTVYHYTTDFTRSTTDMNFEGQESHSFGSVPLTEFVNNENRQGDWEARLDEIDAYDKAISEMANSQEDFSNAKLMLSGDIDFSDRKKKVVDQNGNDVVDESGNPIYVPMIDAKDPYIMLRPSIKNNPNGSSIVVPSDAKYLTKQLDTAGWEKYVDQLRADIYGFTNSPDMSDQAFSGNNTGVAMAYKLFGSDQERSMQESLYKRGLMRRLRLLGYYWYINGEITDQSMVENFNLVFTPNLPKNDTDIVTNFTQLVNSGVISDQTLRSFISQVTGVDADSEDKRVKDQDQQEKDSDPDKVFPINLGGKNGEEQ